MSEIETIFLTSGLSIFGGIFVFSFGQLIQKFLLEPAKEQAKVIGEVLFNLTYYAAWYANPGTGKEDDLVKASNIIRESASRLKATTNAVRWYCLCSTFRLVPPIGDIDKAIKNLIFISNSVHSGNGRDNRAYADEVEELIVPRWGLWPTQRSKRAAHKRAAG